MNKNYSELIIECKELHNGETFPVKYTHRGGDVSPEFKLKNLNKNGKTIVIIFDDLDKPMNHWIIWNLPLIDIIPENNPKENIFENIGNAKQKRQYRGPNPPIGIKHKYQFNIYVLDCELNLETNVNKKELVKAMEGHIIQYGFIYGYYE
jgi:Raf kinase inhibitor-like YbhB/YbcL family protein